MHGGGGGGGALRTKLCDQWMCISIYGKGLSMNVAVLLINNGKGYPYIYIYIDVIYEYMVRVSTCRLITKLESESIILIFW